MYSEETFNEHPVFDAVQKCISSFEKELEDENSDFFRRLLQLCKIISSRLDSVDFYVAPTYLVANINKNLNQALAEFNNFNSSNDTNYLSTTERQIEQALANSKNLFISTNDIEKDYAETLKSFRKSAGQHLRVFKENVKEANEQFKSLKDNLNSLMSEIDQQKGRIDKAVTNFQNQTTNLQQQQLKDFQEKQNSRDKEFKDLTTKISANITGKLNAFEKNTKVKIDEIAVKTSDLIDELQEKRDEALNLVGIVANTGMAGGYQKIANQAMWTKRFWQTMTVLSLFGLIIFSILMYNSTLGSSAELSLGLAGIRVFVTIAIALFAGYSAKQADTNSKVERRNRQMEIELSSIDMYIAKFEEPHQLEIKKKLSEKFFGNLPIDHHHKESKSQTTMLGHLIEAVKNFSEKIS